MTGSSMGNERISRFYFIGKMRLMKKNASRGSYCGDDKGCRRRQEQSAAGKESQKRICLLSGNGRDDAGDMSGKAVAEHGTDATNYRTSGL